MAPLIATATTRTNASPTNSDPTRAKALAPREQRFRRFSDFVFGADLQRERQNARVRVVSSLDELTPRVRGARDSGAPSSSNVDESTDDGDNDGADSGVPRELMNDFLFNRRREFELEAPFDVERATRLLPALRTVRDLRVALDVKNGDRKRKRPSKYGQKELDGAVPADMLCRSKQSLQLLGTVTLPGSEAISNVRVLRRPSDGALFVVSLDRLREVLHFEHLREHEQLEPVPLIKPVRLLSGSVPQQVRCSSVAFVTA